MIFFKRIIIIVFILLLCAPHYAGSQSTQQKILIGILPEMNVFKQKQRFKLLGDYLTKKTGVHVEFTVLSRYGNIIDRFTTGKMDGVFFGSFTGALAIRKLGVVPLARPVNLDNESTYRGYIFVRKDSGIKNVMDMRGKRMAFVDKATTAGYIFPLAYLRGKGIADADHFFSEAFFAGSHDAAIEAVLNRMADVGAAKHSIYDRVRKDNLRVDKELVVLAESSSVPSNGLCVRKDLDEKLKRNLKNALLGLHMDPEGLEVLGQFGALKFIETTVQSYLPVLEMARQAGIDVKNYDYRNQ